MLMAVCACFVVSLIVNYVGPFSKGASVLRPARRCVVGIFLSALSSFAIAADEPGAVINGRVSDMSGNAVAGARIVIRPGDAVLASDHGGRFVHAGLQAGEYSMEISHVGFVTVTQKVRLISGEAVIVVVQLPRTPIVEEVMTVSAATNQDGDPLARRRSLVEAVDLVPREVIEAAPTQNVADAVGHSAGVSLEFDKGEGKYVQIRGLEPAFASVSVDGVRVPSAEADVRQINLAMFPVDSIEMVELYRTAAADRDGDAIAGTLNLRTRTARQGSFLSFRAEGGYNSLQGGRGSGRVSTVVTQRVGRTNALGIVFSATYDVIGRSINDIEPAPAVVQLPNSDSAAVFQGIDLRDYRLNRRRAGLSLGLDYNAGSRLALRMKIFFNQLEEVGDRWITTVTAGHFLTPELTDGSGGYSASAQDRRPLDRTAGFSAGGEHVFPALLLDHGVSYARAGEHRLQRQADLVGPKATFSVDSEDGYFPRFDRLAGGSQLDASAYSVRQLRRVDERASARSVAGWLNATKPLAAGQLKFGTKLQVEHKNNTADDRFYKTTGAPDFLVAANLDRFHDPGYYDGHYMQGPNLDIDRLWSFFLQNPGAFKSDFSKERLTSDPNIWQSQQAVGAAFVMYTLRLDAFELNSGLRVEQTSTRFVGNAVTVDKSGKWVSTTPLGGKRNYRSTLPSISARWTITPETVIRAAYGWTIGRARYDQLVPSQVQDEASATVMAGNPDLLPAKAVSYDLSFERLSAGGGIVAIGFFQKSIANPIYESSSSKIAGGPFDGFTLLRPINGSSALIRGAEVQWQHRFTSLSPRLRPLTIAINYAHTRSVGQFDPSTGRSDKVALLRTAPNVINASMCYAGTRLGALVMLSHTDALIFTYNYRDGAAGGVHGPNGDTYQYPHSQVDAQVSYALRSGITVIAAAQNLNNEPFGFYNGNPRWNIRREFYDRTFILGFRVNRQ